MAKRRRFPRFRSGDLPADSQCRELSISGQYPAWSKRRFPGKPTLRTAVSALGSGGDILHAGDLRPLRAALERLSRPSGPGRCAAEISPASASADRNRGDPAFRPSARLAALSISDFRNMIGTKSLSRPIRFGLSGVGPTNSLSRTRSRPMPRPAVFAQSARLSSKSNRSRTDPPGRSRPISRRPQAGGPPGISRRLSRPAGVSPHCRDRSLMAGETDPARRADALGPGRPPLAHRRGSGRTVSGWLTPTSRAP